MYCPAPDSYVKKKSNFSFDLETRIQMLKEKIHSPMDQILTYVLDHKTTLLILEREFEREFKRKFEQKIYVVLGSDTLKKALQMIPLDYDLIVIHRNGFEVKGEEKRKILFGHEWEEVTLSSSYIREVIQWTLLPYSIVYLITQM